MNLQQGFNGPAPDGADERTAALFSSKSLSDQVTEYLVQQLVSGALAQGQRINEAELSRALGISRNPIREAVSGLQERGILISAPRRGSFVRRFTRDDINSLFAFRMVLERFTIEQAVNNATDADLSALSRLISDMVIQADAGRVLELRKTDMMLHGHFATMSRNRQAINSFASLATEMLILMTVPHSGVETLQAAAMDHFPIIDALRLRSVPAAREAIERHLQNSWDIMLLIHEKP